MNESRGKRREGKWIQRGGRIDEKIRERVASNMRHKGQEGINVEITVRKNGAKRVEGENLMGKKEQR